MSIEREEGGRGEREKGGEGKRGGEKNGKNGKTGKTGTTGKNRPLTKLFKYKMKIMYGKFS
jgi:hypothetical protein